MTLAVISTISCTRAREEVDITIVRLAALDESQAVCQGPAEMLLLVLGSLLSLASAQTLVENSCVGSEQCWRDPVSSARPGALAGDESEARVFAALLCHLDCLDTGDQVAEQ